MQNSWAQNSINHTTVSHDEYTLSDDSGVEYPLKTMQIQVPQHVEPYEMHFPKQHQEASTALHPPKAYAGTSKRYRWKTDGGTGFSTYVKYLQTSGVSENSVEDGDGTVSCSGCMAACAAFVFG